VIYRSSSSCRSVHKNFVGSQLPPVTYLERHVQSLIKYKLISLTDNILITTGQPGSDYLQSAQFNLFSLYTA